MRRTVARLRGIDPPLAGTVGACRQNIVAVCFAARHPALERTAQRPAPGLLGQILQVYLGHDAEQTDVHGRHLAGQDRVQPDAQEGQPVVEIRHVCELAAEPVERFAKHDVELTCRRVDLQLLEPGPEPAGAALRVIYLGLHDRPAFDLGIAPANLELVLDRRLALIVGAVPGVDLSAHGVPVQIRLFPTGIGGSLSPIGRDRSA
jgi:hypothetical protein